MGVLGTVARVSIPSSAVYYSIKADLWAPGAGSIEAQRRLGEQRTHLDTLTAEVKAKVRPYFEPLADQVGLSKVELKLPSTSGAICWYNCAIKTSIKSLADFNGKETFDKLSKLASNLAPAAVEQSTNSEAAAKPAKASA